MFVFKAAVVGAGTMGGEIAQVIASAGIPVVLKDVGQEFVDVGLKKAQDVTAAQLGALVHKQKITQEQADTQAAEILGRITGTTEYAGFGDVDFVIEAVPERMAIKQAVFAELDALVPGHAILASNTSSLSISEIADATSRPDNVVGFHFFYPASMMRLVEVVEGAETSPEAMQTATTFAQTIRKMPITCGEEPGFVVNRILNSAISEIWRFQEANGLSIKAVDDAVSQARVAPMGPFFLTDLLGLDTVLHVAEHLQESYGSESFYVHQGMKALVAAGELGAKTGKGFYDNGQPQRGRGRVRPRRAHAALRAEGVRRGVPAARGRDGDDPRHRSRHDGRRRADPAAVRARRPDRPRRGARRARARRGGVGRAVRAAADPAPARRAGAARREDRPGLLRLQAARRGLRAGRGRPARDARRLRDRLARPAAGELAVAAGGRRARDGSGSTSRRARRSVR